MKNQAALGTPGNPGPPHPPGPRRGSRVVVIALIVLASLGATVAFFLFGTGGMEGRVQKILNGARWEEKRSTGGSSRGMGALMGVVNDLIGKVLPSRQWRGDYHYQGELVKLGTNAVPVLLRVIEKDSSAATRRISAMALAELPAPGVLPCLVTALGNDKDVSVREAVAQTLGRIGDTNAIPALLAALRADPQYRVRDECASGLGNLGGPGIVPELILIAATETNGTVRAQLAGTLGGLQDRRGVPLLVGWLQTPRKEVPEPTSGVALPVIETDEDSGNELQLVSAAATALGNIGGEEAFRALMSQWEREKNMEVRRSLCEALGMIGDPRALPALLAALHEDAVLTSPAVEALGNLGDTNAVAELLPLLGDGDKEVRQKTAEALGLIGSPACVAELLRVAEQDFTTEVRVSACAALGMIGDPKAQEVIIHALPQLGGNRQEAVWALGHVGDTNAVATLAELLGDNERETRFAAAYALAEIGGSAAADAVVAHLEDKDDFARHGKACALAMLGRTNSLAAVRAGLCAKELWQRFGAALALMRLHGVVDAKEWEPMRADRSTTLQHLASEAAEGRSIAALTGLLHDRDNDFRHYAARGLIFFKDPSALPALREACRDSNSEVRNAARLAVRCLERSSSSGK